MRRRDEMIERLRTKALPDILIIGGGINGVGTFRDLAAQNVPVLLVEAGDFSSGTSATPSRLIHGGLRYLETGEAALVRESLTERNLLLKNACHIVQPLPVWVPLRSWFGGTFGAIARFLKLTRTPGRKGAIPVKLGLMLYDAFGRTQQTMPDHRLLTRRQARAEVPVLAPDIRAVAEYYDARITHPERLVMELVADAEAECPESLAIPYLKAISQENGRVTLRDMSNGETFEITPRLVINASGAWVDEVQSGLGFSGRLMGGTRGSHLVLKQPVLAQKLAGKMLYFETDDHRACLIYPMGEDRVFLGTTDIRSDDPGDNFCTDAEIDYLFKVLRPILPNEELRREDIIFTIAGVRPLPLQEAGVTGAISRDHRLDSFPATADRPFETLTLVGGKWTTYRAFAEQVSDVVLQRQNLPRQASTADRAIGGAAGYPFDAADRQVWANRLARDTGLTPERCAMLAQRYGARASAVAKAECADPRQFVSIRDYSPAEISLICTQERVTRLDDIVLRRTLMGFEGALNENGINELAEVAAAALGWTDDHRATEIKQTTQLLRDRHRATIRGSL
ncbi:glycerol-3-phosphate dehydrogenase [Celeribacter baekdonensis]|uniref:Glycerol-3-phosphate dehydrogenase n=1 Tax=Celeribacter baekdonensis TaxID=875171 RepID=A0A1G7Q6J6_9RHOB|nr:glycerol-3-phosphate dehydrogenase/oxidase [Celeribacter baekdonensis]SDF94207.1 glycerol-3-phosphate dehydrogenase [Celeribacter baekdonensis]